MFLGYAFQTAGLQYTTPSKSGFVTGSSVVLVPLLLALFWGRRVSRGAYAGALVAVLGLYYLTIPAEGMAYLNRGDVLTFVAAGLYAVDIILVGEYTRQHSLCGVCGNYFLSADWRAARAACDDWRAICVVGNFNCRDAWAACGAGIAGADIPREDLF